MADKPKTVAEILATSTRDAAAIAATASISYGAWLAWHPAGFLVGGAIVLAFCIWTVLA